MSGPGAFTANIDQGDPDPNNGNGELTGAELHNIMQLCRARLSPEEQSNFDMLNRMSHNGYGDTTVEPGLNPYARDRTRSGHRTGGRDQTPPRPPSTPSSARPTGSNTTLDRRRAHDRRIAQDSAVRALNTESFLKRFPDARKIDVWR
jgi:hypothetical protein